MKLLLEPFTATAGWTPGAGSSMAAYGLNTYPDYVADNLGSSLILHVPSGSSGKTIAKTIGPVDVSKYGELVLSVWSRSKKGTRFRVPTDFAYQISFDGSTWYYLPTWTSFTDVTISLDGVGSVSQVAIKAVHNDEDYLVLSALNAVADEYPLDILNAFANDIAAASLALYPDGFPIADTLSGNAGDKIVALTDANNLHAFVARYALLKIKDPPNTEYHVIEKFDEGQVTFKPSFDGEALKSAHTNAQLFVALPAQITIGDEVDLVVPSIALRTMTPEPVLRYSGAQRFTDTYKVGVSIDERQEEQLLRYRVLIDCEAEFAQEWAVINRVARRFMAQNCTWINARKHDFIFDIPGEEVDPTTVNETLPKSQFSIDIEVKESVWPRAALPLFTTPQSSYTIVAQGGVLPP